MQKRQLLLHAEVDTEAIEWFYCEVDLKAVGGKRFLHFDEYEVLISAQETVQLLQARTLWMKKASIQPAETRVLSG